MFAACGFIISEPAPELWFKHKVLGVEDIEKLKELFPNHSIWSSDVGTGRRFKPSIEQATSFYYALMAYKLEHEISDEEYYVGTVGGLALITSNLRSVFDDLIPFFETELGITNSSTLATT